MKGEFFVEFPERIREDGTAAYRIMYQTSPDAEPQVAQETTIAARKLGDNIEQVLNNAAISFYYKAVAANVGLKRLWKWRAPAKYSSLLEKAFKEGEPRIKGNEKLIFANGLARAKKMMKTDVMPAEYDGQPVDQRNVETKEIPEATMVAKAKKNLSGEAVGNTNAVREYDLNNRKERETATQILFGDSFKEDGNLPENQ